MRQVAINVYHFATLADEHPCVFPGRLIKQNLFFNDYLGIFHHNFVNVAITEIFI